MKYLHSDDTIDKLDLSARAYHCLSRYGILTIGDFFALPNDALLNFRNLGVKTQEEIISLKESILNNTSTEYRLVDFSDVEVEQGIPAYDNDLVFTDRDGRYRCDYLIDKMELPIRAINCFDRNGFVYASDLIGITPEELENFKSLGSTTIPYIMEAYAALVFPECKDLPSDFTPNPKKFGALPCELSYMYGASAGSWRLLLQQLYDNNLVGSEDVLIDVLYRSQSMMDNLCEYLLRVIESQHDYTTRTWLSIHTPRHLLNTLYIEDALLMLENRQQVFIDEDDGIQRRYYSIKKYASLLEREDWKFALTMRLEGHTLEEIGMKMGLTRERVRQILDKALAKRPRVSEDEYLHLFERYKFSAEEFRDIFGFPNYVYSYLDTVAETKYSERLYYTDCLLDESIPTELRRKVEAYMYRNYLTLGGLRVALNRDDLLRYYIKNFVKDAMVFDDFNKAYIEWIESLDIETEKFIIASDRFFMSKLSKSNYVLWSFGKELRYYDFSSKDWDRFFGELNLLRYNNLEISTSLIFNENADLMSEYDVRNHYELHNVLRKVYPPTAFWKCEHMPIVVIGTASREEQMLDLLIEVAPISYAEICKQYEDRFGVEAATIGSIYLRSFGEYFHNGLFVIDVPPMPVDHVDYMMKVLDLDYYDIDEVKSIYKQHFPDSNVEEINSYNIKRLGFNTYSRYIIRDTFKTAHDYITTVLMEQDIIDFSQMRPQLARRLLDSQEMYGYKSERTLIQFAPKTYINIRRLEANGITRDTLNEYCQKILRFLPCDTYFTYKSIHKRGFYDELEDIGCDEVFYTSIMATDPNVSSFVTNGVRVMFSGKAKISLSSFLESIVVPKGKYYLDDLEDLLKYEYGIEYSHGKLIEMAKESNLYYNEIMQAVYDSYDTYLEEI